jgi:hypothetical protein
MVLFYARAFDDPGRPGRGNGKLVNDRTNAIALSLLRNPIGFVEEGIFEDDALAV